MFLGKEQRWIVDEEAKPVAVAPDHFLASFSGLAGICPVDRRWIKLGGSGGMPSSSPDAIYFAPFPRTMIYPGAIFVTEENILCRTQISMTKTSKSFGIQTSKTDLGSAVYGVDYKLTANTKVSLGPLGWKKCKETPAAIVEPLLDEYGEPHTLQILTVHSIATLKLPPPWGLVRGRFIDDAEFSRLKNTLEAQARRLAQPLASETGRSPGSSSTPPAAALAPPSKPELSPPANAPALQTQAQDPRNLEYLARLEELKTRGGISEKSYLKLKDEYWKRLEAPPAAPSPVEPFPAEPLTGKFCINCGASLPAHATFCNKCGTKQ